MIHRLRYFLQRCRRKLAARGGSASYWTAHMVCTQDFKSREESLHHFRWRNAQYPGYIDLMPVSGFDDKIVLDYGCGPGNDLVGFSEYSKCKKIIGVDVSPTALAAARARLAFSGGGNVELLQIEENLNKIPLPDSSVDYIHTSGVLHHCKNLELVLTELHRILKPGGEMSVMVYNYQSLFLHLYVAWMLRYQYAKYPVDMPMGEAFKRSTDGEECPISYCYKPEEFCEKVGGFGFSASFKGAAISTSEMIWLGDRFRAISDIRLEDEHRDFLSNLTFDDRGLPLFNGHVAGIDACYLFRKVE